MHREGQLGDPGPPRQGILQGKASGGGVADGGFGTQVVAAVDQQMGLALRHQRQIAQLPAAVPRQGGRPHQAGGAVAEQIHAGHLGAGVDRRERRQGRHGAPAVARLVEGQPHALAMQVDQIGGAAAVDVRQQQAPRIEQFRMVEQGRVVHRHLGAEPPVAQIRPIADLLASLPGADAHHIRQPVAAHIRQVQALAPIGEQHPRPLLLIPGQRHSLALAESFLRQGAMPHQRLPRAQQQVGVAIAIEVDEAQVGVVEVEVGQLAEGFEGLPALPAVMGVEPRQRPAEGHQIRPAIALQIQHLRPRRQAHGRPAGHGFQRREGGHRLPAIGPQPLADRAQVALVDPFPRLLAEEAWQSLAVQIQPAIGAAIQADRQVLQAGGIHRLQPLAQPRLAVAELQRRQIPAAGASVLLLPARLHHLAQEAVDRPCGQAGIVPVVVEEAGAAHHALVARLGWKLLAGGLVGDVVQHQHPLAAAAGAHLKTGAVAGEGIGPIGPGPLRHRGGIGLIQLAVVEAHLKQPVGGCVARRLGSCAQVAGALAVCRQ